MTSAMYTYVRARQLEGTFPGDHTIGAWIISANRVFRGWGVPDEKDWPYNGDPAAWPPVDPPNIDDLAKPNRIFAYQRVRTVDECRLILALRLPIIAAFEISDQWFSAKEGNIADTLMLKNIGSHSVCMIDYDDMSRRFTFANTWGRTWGRDGYGSLSYKYFEMHQLEAWTILPDMPAQRMPTATSIEINWGISDVLGSALHGIEFQNSVTDDRIGWAFTVERDGFLDIEEVFVRPAYRAQRYGSLLTQGLLDRSRKLSLPLRIWISHADQNEVNHGAAQTLIKRLQLSLIPSHVRWAAYVGTRA